MILAYLSYYVCSYHITYRSPQTLFYLKRGTKSSPKKKTLPFRRALDTCLKTLLPAREHHLVVRVARVDHVLTES